MWDIAKLIVVGQQQKINNKLFSMRQTLLEQLWTSFYAHLLSFFVCKTFWYIVIHKLAQLVVSQTFLLILFLQFQTLTICKNQWNKFYRKTRNQCHTWPNNQVFYSFVFFRLCSIQKVLINNLTKQPTFFSKLFLFQCLESKP